MIRLLNGPLPWRFRPERVRRRLRSPSYGPVVMSVLQAVWEAAGYPWSVRLKALLPLWMPWVRQDYRVSPEVECQRLAISARQIDRRLQKRKQRDAVQSPAEAPDPGEEPRPGSCAFPALQRWTWSRTLATGRRANSPIR